MTGHNEAEALLAMWREIERSLAAAEPGSPDAERLQTEAGHVRDAYQRLVARARAADGPMLPTFGEPTSAS